MDKIVITIFQVSVVTQTVLGGLTMHHPVANFLQCRVVQKTVPLFYFCDNFRKCAPILTIFSMLEPEIYDA